MLYTPQLEAAIWSISDGRSSDDDLALFHADERASLVVLDRLIIDTEEDLASVRNLPADERDVVVADLTDTLACLRATAAILRPPPPEPAPEPDDDLDADDEDLEPGEVQLQASWADGQVVVWAAGRGTAPETNAELSARLEAIGGPPLGWQTYPSVALPGGMRAEALAIPVKDALGWLVAVGGGHGRVGVGASVLWLGHVALEGVRLAAAGSIVPSLRVPQRPQGRVVDVAVRWKPALVDSPAIVALAAAMPGTVAALGCGDGRVTTTAVVTAVVEAIVNESVERMELPAEPPSANTATDLGDAVIARMDGQPFQAPAVLASNVSRTLEHWTRTVTSSSRPRLVVQLDAPGPSGVWLVTVSAPSAKGDLVPIDAALRAERGGRHVAGEWARLDRLFPALNRSGVRRRGQVALSQDEAWGFMTVIGPTLAAVGFDVRVPKLSLRRPSPSLRLFAETPADSVVGARQLSNVAWSVLFDDVELSAADIARLARQARPLVQSRGRWVEVDRVDLQQAAAALAEREAITQLTGAEILRHSIGLDGSGLRGGVTVQGNSWANDILRRASTASTSPVTRPEGFVGELRTYQAEALAWIGFLDAAELGGCLALDMGLGKTPTVLAQLARMAGDQHRSRHRPGRGRRQLGRGGRPLRTRSARRRPPRLVAFIRCSAPGRDRRRRRRDHHLRHRGPRRRSARGRRRGGGSCSTRRRRSRTRRARPTSSCGGSRHGRGSRSRARRSRTGSAICGRSSISRTPASSGPDRHSSPRCRATAKLPSGR